jgi:hypothetical protein
MTATFRRGPGGAIVLAALVVATACSSGGVGTITRDSTPSRTPTPSAEEFCTAWQHGLSSASEDELSAAARLAPPELADDAELVESADERDPSPAAQAAAKRIYDWATVNCASGTGRHVAPPADADLAGFELCGVFSIPPPATADETSAAVSIYGEADRADPYDGPMLAVLTAPTGSGGFAGDGDRTPVTVRGLSGEAAPITVFQQSVVPELGTVVAWTENGEDVGVFGRLWGKERVPELVAIADRLEPANASFTVPDDALPHGYELVYRGKTDATWSLVGGALFGDYSINYRDGGANIYVSGWKTTPDGFDRSRFFALPLAHERIGDRDALFGSAWSDDKGPWVAMWREPDGLAVRVIGLGASATQTRGIAVQARDLNHAEWGDVVASAKDCGVPVP